MESVIATREEVQHFLSVPSLMADFRACVTKCLCRGFSDKFGDGFGTSDGAGYGSGNGDDFGLADASGFGCGSGSGYGTRDSCGFSYGGSGIRAFNGNIVDYIDNVPTIITQIHSNIAKGYIVKHDFTLQSCYIAKVGSFFAHGKTLKDAIADVEAKEAEKLPIEKRIEKFIKVFGSLDSEHTGKEFYDWHHILTGSCKMGRDGFCKDHDIDLEKKYTVKYFLDITEKSYGGDVIKRVRESYEFGKN